jgi:hypothetical protein
VSETYYNDQVVTENGQLIKISVEHEVNSDGRDVVIRRIVGKHKKHGGGFAYRPFETVVEGEIRMSFHEAPELVSRLMWAMATGAEELATERLARKSS